MKKSLPIFLLIITILIVSTSFNPQNICLCNKKEENIITFKIKNSTKSVSICEGHNSKYLVYRFGRKDKIELEFPSSKDESSWKKFEYFSYYRGGGYQNAATSIFHLSFINKNVKYKVYHSYAIIDSSGELNTTVGIDVEADKNIISLEGDPSTIHGSLGLINEEKINKIEE